MPPFLVSGAAVAAAAAVRSVSAGSGVAPATALHRRVRSVSGSMARPCTSLTAPPAASASTIDQPVGVTGRVRERVHRVLGHQRRLQARRRHVDRARHRRRTCDSTVRDLRVLGEEGDRTGFTCRNGRVNSAPPVARVAVGVPAR
ncbi:hypothetical protein ACQP1W_34365 [Spirillospora sp. CA-255316]